MTCYIVFTWLRAHWWPGTHCTAPAGITVAWPGHNGDCAQASHWFVALCSVGVVARGRLVVCEVRCWATMLVGLMAAHAHPAGNWWHFKLWTLVAEEAQTDSEGDEGDYCCDTVQAQDSESVARSPKGSRPDTSAPQIHLQKIGATAPHSWETLLVHWRRTFSMWYIIWNISKTI